MPLLIPCNSSPPPGFRSTMKISVISNTSVSDCPTPTVSTRVTLNPAASTMAMDSLVERFTPPKLSPEGEGLMNTFLSRLRDAILVLSARMEPPLMDEVGSTARMANRLPSFRISCPSASIKVDLPTPGVPEIPILMEDSLAVPSCSSNASAMAWSSAFIDSIRVIACAIAFLSPDLIPSAKSTISDASNSILKFKNSLINH